MLSPNLFSDNKIQESQTERALLTLLNLNKENNKILRVDTKEEALSSQKYLLNSEDAISVAAEISILQDKNVFLLNETFNDSLKNLFTNIKSNFQKLYFSLFSFPSSLLEKGISLSILNMISGHHSAKEKFLLQKEEIDVRNDICLLRNFGKMNIFIPADANEVEYLLKINEKGFFKNRKNNLSYFRINNYPAPEIFRREYFIKEDNLKEWTGMPEIIHVPNNLDSAFEVAIISCGPVIYNALMAARDLEEKNYKVTILNMSLISSNSEYINQKIKSFILNFVNNHKNILVVEEHSKVGGLGSLVAEIVLENRNSNNIRVERLGLEDDLSSQNIISKAEEISGF